MQILEKAAGNLSRFNIFDKARTDTEVFLRTWGRKLYEKTKTYVDIKGWNFESRLVEVGGRDEKYCTVSRQSTSVSPAIKIYYSGNPNENLELRHNGKSFVHLTEGGNKRRPATMEDLYFYRGSFEKMCLDPDVRQTYKTVKDLINDKGDFDEDGKVLPVTTVEDNGKIITVYLKQSDDYINVALNNGDSIEEARIYDGFYGVVIRDGKGGIDLKTPSNKKIGEYQKYVNGAVEKLSKFFNSSK